MSTQKDIFDNIEIPHIGGSNKKIDISNGLVIVGANGSGKTRLGNFIEKQKKAFLIEAQRMLKIPEGVNFIEMHEKKLKNNKIIATNQKLLILGNQVETDTEGNPKIPKFVLSLQGVFIDYYHKNFKFIEGNKNTSKISLPIPDTVLKHIIKIWSEIFSDKQFIVQSKKMLFIRSNSMNIKRDNYHKDYNVSEMSDGEKSIFYFIILLMMWREKSNTIIIDEPENHLHKSIRSKFWDEIEAQRKDCKFIYITHDTDFAASRTKAKKIWLKSYHCTKDDKGKINEAWDWEEIGDGQNKISGNLLAKVLDVKPPTLFVEGENGNFDHRLFQSLFPNLFVKPLGSCSDVEKALKFFKKSTDVFGLIDRDFLTDDEVKTKKSGDNKLYIMDVAEIENLICVPEILKLLKVKDKFDKILQSEDFLSWLRGKKQEQINLRFIGKAKNLGDTKSSREEFFDERNKIYSDSEIKVAEILPKDNQTSIDKAQYKEILKFYNGKELAEEIAKELGYGGKKELFNALIAYIEESDKNEKSDNRQNVLNALSPYLNGLVEAIEGKPENK